MLFSIEYATTRETVAVRVASSNIIVPVCHHGQQQQCLLGRIIDAFVSFFREGWMRCVNALEWIEE